MIRILLISTLLIILGGANIAFAQGEEDHSYKPMMIKLNDDGSKNIRFYTWFQFWGKATETNPNYTDVEGNKKEETFDIGIRRARFMVIAQVSPRYMILAHMGINNQEFNSGGAPGMGGKKPQLFFHDVWNEFRVIKDKLYIGAGLHYWNGVSRMSNASTLNFMTLDAPIFNWQNIELTDQFGRQFGVYAKGKLGKFDYRFALNKPFSAGVVSEAPNLSPNAVNVKTNNFAQAGYVDYQFLDQESDALPFRVGSYLGGKNIFNIGAGFYHHKDASGNIENGQVEKHDHTLVSADVFWEKPFSKTAISLYSAFYNFDYGPNYLRQIGIMGETGGTPGANAQPTIGTGSIWYTQLGYLLPKFKGGQQIMPYVTFTMKDFEAIGEVTNQFDVGANYFISGHNAKITLQYSNRPVWHDNEIESKGELILQTHIFL